MKNTFKVAKINGMLAIYYVEGRELAKLADLSVRTIQDYEQRKNLTV